MEYLKVGDLLECVREASAERGGSLNIQHYLNV